MLTINALAVANKVVIPVDCQYLATKGMVDTLNIIRKVQRNINKNLKMGKVLFTLVDKRTNLPKIVHDEIKKNYGNFVKIYDSQIPRAIKTAESTSRGKSIFAYDHNSKVAEAYSLFAKEVLMEDEKERRKNVLAKDSNTR